MRIRFSSHTTVRPSRRVRREAPVSFAPGLAPHSDLARLATSRSLRLRSMRGSLSAARRVSLALALCTPLCAGALLAGPSYAAPVNHGDENGPQVSILKPAYNDVLKGNARILIAVKTGSSNYNPQSIEMFVDDVSATDGPIPISSFLSSSYNFDTHKFSDGPHKLTVRVTDTQGFRGWSEVQIFINNAQVVDTTPPELKWDGISPFQTFSGTMKIQVGASDNFGVKLLQIFVNPADNPNKVPASYSWLLNHPPYSVNLDTLGKNVPDGLYTLRALAYDSLDQQGEAPPLTFGIVNNALNATTVGEMLDSRHQMAAAVAAQNGPAKVETAKVGTTKVETKTAPQTPKVVATPSASANESGAAKAGVATNSGGAQTTVPLHAVTPDVTTRAVPNATSTSGYPTVKVPTETVPNVGIAAPKVTVPTAQVTPPAPRIASAPDDATPGDQNAPDAPDQSVPAVPAPASDPKPIKGLIPEDMLPGANLSPATDPKAVVKDPVEADPENGTIPLEQIPTIPTPATPTETPAVDQTTQAPTAETTVAPTTEVPATEVPATVAPTTEVPATEVPVTPAPAVDLAQTPKAPADKPKIAAMSGARSAPVGNRYGDANLSRRGEALDMKIAPVAPAKTPVASAARASEARFSLPAFSARAVQGAPAWSQNVRRDDSRATTTDTKNSGALRAPMARVTAAALTNAPRLLGASAPSMPSIIERAVSQPRKTFVAKTGATKRATPRAATPRATTGKVTNAVQNNARVKPIEIAPARISNGAIVASGAPLLSAPDAPRIAPAAPSALSKAVPRAGVNAQNPRLSLRPRPDAANGAASNRDGVAAITAVPMSQPLQIAAASNVPASYRIERTTTLRAVAQHFGLPVELVALSNDWPTEMKLVKGMNVKLPRPLQVSYNGAAVQGDAPSMLVGDTAVTAFRFLFEQSGGSLKWDSAKQRVIARKGGQEITLNIGSKVAKVGDREVMMELAAFLFEGRTMVPLRFFEESLNAEVEWDPQTGRLVVAMVG